MLRSQSVRKSNIQAGGAPTMVASMEHTRLGLLYFFSHIEFGSTSGLVARGVLNIAGASTYFASEMGAKMLLKDVGSSTAPSMNAAPPSGLDPTLMAKVVKIAGTGSKELFDLMGKAVGLLDEDLAKQNMPCAIGWKQELQEVWNLLKDELVGLIKKGIESAVYFIVPYLKSAVHLFESVEEIVKGAILEYKMNRLARDIGIHEGASEIIVNGVNNAIGRNWARTTLGAMKSIFDMVAEVVGASVLKSFVGFIESIIETAVGTVWKVFEIRAMTRFCGEAEKHLEMAKTPGSIHRNPWAFAEWISGPFERIPMLACLAVKSRICGDYTTMASLVDDDGYVVSSKRYADTRKYFDLLIKNADSYLKNNDLFVKGKGDDGLFVESLLKDRGTIVMGKAPVSKESYWETMVKGRLADRMLGMGDYVKF